MRIETAKRRCCTMHDMLTSRTPGRDYAEPVRAALACLGDVLVEGLKHGHFKYAINCEIGTTAGAC